MTDSTNAADAATLTAPGPPPPAPPGLPTGSDRFYSWVSGLGMVRADGWLGGVCGGIASRIRIDPIIVRGVFVVVALLGFPALVIYAIAWALLPDTSGRIHLRETFRGRFDPVIVGIALVLVVGLIPGVPWLWNTGWSLLGFIAGIIAIVLIGGIVFLVAHSARRGGRATTPPDATGSRMASADHGTPGSSVEPDAASGAASPDPEVAAEPDAVSFAASGSAAWAPEPATDAFSAPESADAPSVEPASAPEQASMPGAPSAPGPQPAPGAATDAELAQWRAQHDAWRAQDDAWRNAQRDAERLAREQVRAERHAAGVAFAAEAAERRRVRRASKPRASFVFVLAVLGAVAVAGAVGSLVALGNDDAASFAGAIGVLCAATVSAVAMIVAGIVRRRSGFLAFITIVLLCAGLVVAVFSGRQYLSISPTYLGVVEGEDRVIFQPFGTTQIEVFPPNRQNDVRAGDITVRKGSQDTSIHVQPGTVLKLDAVVADGTVTFLRYANETGDFISEERIEPTSEGPDGANYRLVIRNPDPDHPGVTTQVVHLDYIGTGSINVSVAEPEMEQAND